jgi:hypothetical protein
MSAKQTARRWASRVDPLKVRQLYQSDAQGRLDEDLLPDVGYGIYARRQALLEVSAAWRGRVKCWHCGNIILRQEGQRVEYAGHGPTRIGGKAEVLTCDRRGWQTTSADYCKSTSRQGLNATSIEDVLEAFVERWPSTRRPHARLILIDSLVHEFHLCGDSTIGSPVASAVIRATSEAVLALLDELAYGPGSTPGLEETRQRWASHLEAKQAQRPLSELRAVARELDIRGRSHMRRAELQAAIERVAPGRLARPSVREKERE